MSTITKRLPLAVAISAVATTTLAGGFDNSGQPFDIILGSGNEISIMTYSTTAEVTGTANSDTVSTYSATAYSAYNTSDSSVNDVATDYMSAEIGGRLAFSDSLSCAFETDEPYKTNTHIDDDSLSYFGNGISNSAAEDSEDTAIDTKVSSVAWTVGCGYGLHMGSGKLTFFAGPKFQSIHGYFSADMMNDYASAYLTALYGSAYASLGTGDYDNLAYDMGTKYETGYVAGVGYEIEEIALKIGLFYHSAIDYTLKGTVTAGEGIQTLQGYAASETVKADLTTPQAVNLTMQSGVYPGWLVFGNLRWTEWSTLDSLNVTSTSGDYDVELGLFSNDTLDYTLGVGHQFTDKFVMVASYAGGTDLGSTDLEDGVDSDSLRQPRGDYYTLATGGRYSFTDNFSVTAGLGYTYLSEATVDNNSYTVVFDQTEAWTYALGMNVTF